jgi:hypothetical protein
MNSTVSACDTMRVPNALEASAIRLHDHMWENLGVNDDWPLQMTGDDDAVTRLVRLLNELQDEIKSSGIPHRNYHRVLP